MSTSGFASIVASLRGQPYAEHGDVSITSGSDRRVTAVVRGTSPYEVRLVYRVTQRGTNLLHVVCTCPIGRLDPCKHAFAALRVAQHRGLLAALPRECKSVHLVVGAPPGEEEEVEGDEAAEDEEREERWLIDLERCHAEQEITVADALGDPIADGASIQRGAPWAIRRLAETGRCDVIVTRGEAPEPLEFDEGDAYRFVLAISDGSHDPVAGERSLVVRGELHREGEIAHSSELSAIFPSELAFIGSRGLRVRLGGLPFEWALGLCGRTELEVAAEDATRFLSKIVERCGRGSYRLPASLASAEATLTGVRVRVRKPEPLLDGERGLVVDVAFDYGPTRVAWNEAGDRVVDITADRRRIFARDHTGEERAIATLISAGFRWPTTRRSRTQRGLAISAPRLTRAILALPADRFVVEADGAVVRQATSTSFRVVTNIDWFDLQASVDFGGFSATMPALLAATRRGENLVRLGDGSLGILPDDWLARVRRVQGLAEEDEGQGQGEDQSRAMVPAHATGSVRLRFGRSQLTLIDALLADERDPIAWTGPLGALRTQLSGSLDLPSLAAPQGFHGQLRDYQQTGLAWMTWLESIGFSGCLADDMGLGKTIQVLALLADRKARDRAEGPSLVVAPRSVVYNWIDEARRFAPGLRVVEVTGSTKTEDVASADLLVTTYAVMRRVVQDLAKLPLDYVILDEAHAIKNGSAITHKAARILRSRHRLALTGTPVENHLGELVALFDFLNPGMLGSGVRATARRGFDLDADTGARIGRGLRPFVLQRKKADVLEELPARVDQTIACVMESEQRAQYDRVKRYYQKRLLSSPSVEEEPSRFVVLEALLRLRQIACHPGLVDPSLAGRRSAKIEVLLEHLDPIVRAGKKALVFSQFTTLLDIAGKALEDKEIRFERLDGTTSDRQGVVQRFQSSKTTHVFLISLKAGGVGLNLTAAEYVFLLDPWWNPAVEAQAIDRAHRMGQTRTVFSYRLLCKDTIEDRVAELQAKKRELVTSVFSETEGMRPGLGSLSASDVESLLA